MSFNRITGSIPPALWGFQSLERLNLARNSLGGSIPSDIGQLTELRELELQNNVMTGSIPAQIGALTVVGESYSTTVTLAGKPTNLRTLC